MEQLSLFENKKEKSNDWKWTMATDYPAKNGLKVFSCFACGGGSTMGYKLVGCDVIGCNEIDPRMNKVYVENHHPKFNYLEDIRDFNKREDLPQELYNLDVLDGSPPCSTFSMAGQREDAWGKEKKFREGQKLQTLDDLLFVFIDTVAKLQPKVAILENVEGLTLGNAWKYVQQIYKKFHDIGYKVKHWLLKGETMGVPQTRHRVFFVATRLVFDLEKINMWFNYEPITYGEIRTNVGKKVNGETLSFLVSKIQYGDKDLSDASGREFNRPNLFFNNNIVYDEKVCNTIPAGDLKNISYATRCYLSNQDIINASTFPQDYNFLDCKPAYICGMSVPPIMIKRLLTRLIESGLFDYKLKEQL